MWYISDAKLAIPHSLYINKVCMCGLDHWYIVNLDVGLIAYVIYFSQKLKVQLRNSDHKVQWDL